MVLLDAKMRRSCLNSGLVLLQAGRRPPQSIVSRNSTAQLVRSYGWNPFLKKKRVSLEGVEEDGGEGESNSADRRELLIKVKQELRKPLQFDQLASLLQDLAQTSPNKDSFALINEILRKLEQRQSTTPVNTQVPPISTNDAYALFRAVIDNIDTGNFKSARFLPRLYLQLTQVASSNKNQMLSLQVFNDFIRYLIVLGHEEQLIKVVNSFIQENSSLAQPALDGIVITLTNHHPTPSLTLKLLESFKNTDTIKDEHLLKMKKLVVKSIDDYLSKRNELYAIDQHNLQAIQSYIEKESETISENATAPESLAPLLKLCYGRDLLNKEETSILIQTIKYLLNNKDYSCKYPDILKTFTDAFVKNTEISYEERKMAGNIMFDSYKKHFKGSSAKEWFDLFVKWDVFTNASFNEEMKNFLLNQKQYVDENTYAQVIKSMSFAPISDFDTALSEVDDFFKTNFPELERSIEIHTLLLERGIRLNDASYLKKSFTESLNDGIIWDSNPKILCDFVYVLANEENADVKDVFRWYQRVKVSVKYLDSKSYNSLMKLFLKNELIGDAIASLTKELPPLEDKDTKYSADQYPELFNSMYNWILEYNGDPEVSWTLFGELQKYFHVPYDAYFPLMKKFVSLKRPDASFMIFQKMKKIHRTTGSIPPPTPEMYCFLFQAFGEDLYEEGVKHLHIIMKLDMQLNTNINVMNSLLGAYCNLQEYFRTQETFDSIISMPEGKGLNHETISIMLKSYTYVSLGHAKTFWDNIYEYHILPNEDNFRQYIIAHCYHEQYDKALEIASEVEDYDLLVTPEIIKSLYNWTQGQDKKLKVEEWASKNHTLIWNNVKKELTSGKLATNDQNSNDINQDVEARLIHENVA